MNKIIVISGKQYSGKDTLAKVIENQLGIKQICSYTTRPKRDYEINGKEHWFVTPEESEKIKAEQTLLAYAHKPSGVEYYATLESFESDKIVYIIDPEGIYWMRENVQDKDKAKLFIVELYADDKSIEPRIKARGDNWEQYCERIKNEHDEFEDFHRNGNPNVSISALLTVQQVYAHNYEDTE